MEYSEFRHHNNWESSFSSKITSWYLSSTDVNRNNTYIYLSKSICSRCLFKRKHKSKPN
jgi:hypothetical protein